MKIIEKNLEELIPYENNPRNNADAVDAVVASIEEFGFKQPIVIDKDNVIVAGHTRYMAAQKLELKSVPCVVADDLTPEQVRAYRLADNKTAELAGWDFPKLDLEMQSLDMFDMSVYGFHDDPEPMQKETSSTSAPKNREVMQCPACGFEFEL